MKQKDKVVINTKMSMESDVVRRDFNYSAFCSSYKMLAVKKIKLVLDFEVPEEDCTSFFDYAMQLERDVISKRDSHNKFVDEYNKNQEELKNESTKQVIYYKKIEDENKKD